MPTLPTSWNKLQFILWRFDRLAQQREGLQRIVETFFPFLEAILQQHFWIDAPGAVIKLGGINRDGVLNFLEQVFVIDDVAEVLVLAVQPVDTADCLEQAVVLHGLVDVQISAGRRVETPSRPSHWIRTT